MQIDGKMRPNLVSNPIFCSWCSRMNGVTQIHQTISSSNLSSMCQISFMHVIFIIPMTVTNFFYHLSTFVDFDELFRLVDVGIATLWRLFIGDVIADLWLDRLWCRIDFRLRWSERKMLPSLVTRIRWLMAPLWPSWWGFGAFATFHHLHWGNPWREISLIASPALTMSIFTLYRVCIGDTDADADVTVSVDVRLSSHHWKKPSTMC